MLFRTGVVVAWLVGSSVLAQAPAERPDPRVVFSTEIQPLLAKHCLLCHGPDEAEGGLRLDVAEHAYALLDSGERAIVPGDENTSHILRRVSTADDLERMPPEGDPLSEAEIALR